MEQISFEKPKARKQHRCEGIIQILDLTPIDPPLPECKGINKGDVYIKQVNKIDDIYTWKSCKTCFDFIQEHGLYGEF